MNLAVKSALLSGLVLPGLGQIYLKYYFRGVFYALTSLVTLSIIVVKILFWCQLLFEKIKSSANGNINLYDIRNQVNAILKNQNVLLYQFLTYVLMACWIISTIEAYYLGKKKHATLRTQYENLTLP